MIDSILKYLTHNFYYENILKNINRYFVEFKYGE